MNIRIASLFLTIMIGLIQVQVNAAEVDVMATAGLREIEFTEDVYEESAFVETELQNEAFERGSDLENLLRAKYRLINGDLRMTKFYLNRIDDKKRKLYPIKIYYQSLVSFIEGDFEQSLIHLKNNHLNDVFNYPKVCLLKLINYMAVNDTESINKEKNNCMFYTAKNSKNDQYWLDTMIKLKLKDSAGVRKNILTDVEYTLSDDEMAKLWLKTGLYLNKEKSMLDLISLLPESSYQSKRLREIVAFMYLRSGKSSDHQKALAFIDDIDSANAENIKGNINLQNKEYELAFGHFRIALQKKQDSSNSLERAIPLAWILSQWTDGLTMLESTPNKKLDPRNVRAIRIAFLIRDKKFEIAQKELTLLKIDFQHAPPFEVNIMDSYVALMMGATEKKFDRRKAEESSEKSCKDFDGISCWTSLQFIQWENLGKTIKRNEEIITDKELSIESLKEKKTHEPLKEIQTVDQRDIEELDGQSIELMKVQAK